MLQQSERKVWSTPEVQRFGSFAEVTKQDKELGPTDGLTFQGNVIRNAS